MSPEHAPTDDQLATIETLESQVEEAALHLRELKAALRQARLDALAFKVGEVVEAERLAPRRPGQTGARRARAWEPAIIRNVENLWSPTPSYWVSWRRKDGTWATQVSFLYGGIRKPQEPSQ